MPNPDITLILPVYNEAECIRRVVEEWSAVLKDTGAAFEIRICEDGSTDGTKDVIKKMAIERPEIALDSVDYRRGYGRALIDGFTKARGEYVVTSDSDGQINPAGFKALWEKRNTADIVMGVRLPRRDSAPRKFYSFIFRCYFKALFPCKLRDPSTSLVLIKKATAQRLLPWLTYMVEGFGWGFVAAAIELGFSFAEVVIEHRERFAGGTRVYHLRKLPKIMLRNGIGLMRLKKARVT
jgi:glycosyltransferase involved in cell wall biosynthesis